MTDAAIGSGSYSQTGFFRTTEKLTNITNPEWNVAAVLKPALKPTYESDTSGVASGSRQQQGSFTTKISTGGDTTFEFPAVPIMFDLLAAALASEDNFANSPVQGTPEVIRNGDALVTYAMQSKLQAQGGGFEYIRADGVTINTFAIKATENAKVEITAGMLGGNTTHTTTEIAGSTYITPPMNDVLTANTVDILLYDNANAQAEIKQVTTEFTITFDNSQDAKFKVGQKTSIGIRQSLFKAMVEVKTYFRGETLAKIAENDTTIDTMIKMKFSAGLELEIRMPNCKLRDYSPEPGANSEDNVQSFKLMAEPSATIDGRTVSITRLLP